MSTVASAFHPGSYGLACQRTFPVARWRRPWGAAGEASTGSFPDGGQHAPCTGLRGRRPSTAGAARCRPCGVAAAGISGRDRDRC